VRVRRLYTAQKYAREEIQMSNVPSERKKSAQSGGPGKSRSVWLLASMGTLLMIVLYWGLSKPKPSPGPHGPRQTASLNQLLPMEKETRPVHAPAFARAVGQAAERPVFHPGSQPVSHLVSPKTAGPQAGVFHAPARGPVAPLAGDAVDTHIVSRSQARQGALLRLMDHLPAGYLSRFTKPHTSGAGRPKPDAPGRQALVVFGERTGSRPAGKSGEDTLQNTAPIRITMLVYSDHPESRWVTINGEKVHEGEQISEGPKIEKITPKGVVLSFGGRQFYRDMRAE
jgi:hypothetical protein